MPSDDLRVVVVDDCTDAAESLAALLTSNGCQAHIATSASEALDLVARHRPHCVIFDIMMPGVSGDALCSQLRASYRDDMVLIAVSGYGDTEPPVAKAFTMADHYFRKPIDPRALAKLLHPVRR